MAVAAMIRVNLQGEQAYHCVVDLVEVYLSYHFVVDLVEVYLADLVHHILVLVGDKPETSVSVGLFVEHQHRILDLKKRSKMFWDSTLVTKILMFRAPPLMPQTKQILKIS